MSEPIRVLFVCVGNCVRSQMAEAIARHCCGDIIAAESAGVSPLGFIDKTAKMVLHQKGISVHGQFSKGLQSEDWEVEDPFGEDIEVHRRICDSIEARVTLLAAQLRTAVRDNSTEPRRG